jgi:hypothetical protein
LNPAFSIGKFALGCKCARRCQVLALPSFFSPIAGEL